MCVCVRARTQQNMPQAEVVKCGKKEKNCDPLLDMVGRRNEVMVTSVVIYFFIADTLSAKTNLDCLLPLAV